MATTAANTLAERTPTMATVQTAQTTTSTSFTDLTTPGPAITIATGPAAFISILSRVEHATAGGIGRVSPSITGATTITADTNIDMGLGFQSATSGSLCHCSSVFLLTGLTAGNNTITLKYRTDAAGTATFSSRRVSALPF